jgi:hypothetical protein
MASRRRFRRRFTWLSRVLRTDVAGEELGRWIFIIILSMLCGWFVSLGYSPATM